MGHGVRNGLLAIVAVGALAFVGHWTLNASNGASGAILPPSIATPAKAVSTVNPDVARILTGTGEKYALEIRSIGLAVKGAHQDTVWKQIQAKASNYESILSSDPKDYGKTPDERKIFSKVATGAAFKYAAGEAVGYWPIPVIIFGPPRGPNAVSRAALRIADGRNEATLGVTEFLWLDDHNATSAAPGIAELFEFFDRHPDVPAALVLTQDGMQHRWTAQTPGTQPSPTGPFVPPVPDSAAGLLVTRTDRVDNLVRPYAVDVPGDIDKTKTQYDVIKLWNFYWNKDAQFQDEMDKATGAFHGAFTMKADWWTAQLPELWKHISNKGPGEFKPTPYLPVRWTDWQLQQFDAAPRLGYLHRPVQVKLSGDDGKPLKREAEVKRLQEGWKQALATLPDVKLSRVFYDTTLDHQWAIPLTQALHGNAQGIDIADVRGGYDIGRRIGNTGVSSALVQLCLATIAGYEDGGASATVNLTDQGSASIVMVSPPDAASKAVNQKNRGPNPFKYGLP